MKRKRTEKTTPFSLNAIRSQVLPGCPGESACYNLHLSCVDHLWCHHALRKLCRSSDMQVNACMCLHAFPVTSTNLVAQLLNTDCMADS